MPKLAILAALGAVVGSLLRYCVSLTLVHTTGSFPWSTVAVNVVGAFVIGMLASHSAIMNNEPLRVFAVTGVLGGFTTFSALTVDVVALGHRPAIAIGYLAITFGAGLIATRIGWRLHR